MNLTFYPVGGIEELFQRTVRHRNLYLLYGIYPKEKKNWEKNLKLFLVVLIT